MTTMEQLRQLHEERVGYPRRPAAERHDWERVTERARAHKQASMLVHNLGLTADQLRAGQLDSLDPTVRDALVELGDKFDGLSRPEILEMYSSEAALSGLRHATRGTLMELEVEALLTQGSLELPEEATTFVAADRSEPSADGWFYDADGELVDAMQIKASEDAAIILGHLRENPRYTGCLHHN